MAIIQISKIIHRTGANVDLPQLDEGELGFATDDRKLYIGNDPNLYPALANGLTTQTEILTEISSINWSKIDGTGNSTLNFNEPIIDGQLFVANNNTWTNAGGPTGTLTIDLGDADNVLLRGGLNGYVLTTDGTGNLSWQGSGVITYGIANVSKANPAVVTTTGNNAVTTGVAVTIFGVSGMTQLPTAGANGTNKFYAYKISSTTFSLYSDVGLTAPVNSGGFSPAIANTGNAVVSFYQSGIGLPGGSNTQIQFNDGFGTFGGSANYTFNKVTNTLRVVGNANVTNLNATSTINGNLNGPIGVSTANTGAFTTITTTSTISASGNVNTTGNVSVLGNIVSSRNITGNNVTISNNLTTGNLSINGNIQSNLIPNANVTYNLGNNTNRWNDLYLAGNTVYLGNLTLSVDANGLNIPANIVASNANLGNTVRANFITGTLTSSSQPNITSIGALANLSVTGNVNLGNVANVKLSGGVANYVLTTDGSSNLSWQPTQFIATPAAGGNRQVQFNDDDDLNGDGLFQYNKTTNTLAVPIITATTVSVTGNVASANLSVSTNLAANVISATGTITSANLNTGIISTTGNITSSANVNAGSVSASGNVNANRLNANLVGTGALTATGNTQINGTLSVGNTATFSQNANISGNLVVSGNITGNNITSNSVTSPSIIGNAANLGNLSVTGNATINAANISTNLNVTNTINATQVNANLTGIMSNGTSNAQFTAINGSFAVSVGGNPNVLTVTNSSISAAGNITAAGAIAASNLIISGNANIASGNINATGNINANSSIAANGNVNGNNLNSTNNISAAGNVTANNFFGRIQGALANGNSNVSIATANGNIVLTSGGNSTLTVTPANITVSGNTVIAGNTTTINLTASGNINANNVIATSNIAANNLSLSGTITSGAITSNGLISTTGNVSAGNLNITANSSIASGNLNVAGNITGNNSNIANMYGNFISINGLANVVTLNANGSISSTGNVTSAANVNANNASVGNLITAGALTVTANVQGGNFNASNAITAGGSLLVNSITSNTTISAGGNVSVTGNVAVAQAITATGNISTSANLTVAVNANVNGNLRVDGNVSSNLIPSANNTYNLGTPTQRWQDLYLSNSTIYLGTTTLSANASGISISGNVNSGNLSTGNINATGVASVVGVVASGNVLAGNVNAVTNATVGGSLIVTQWANSGNITTTRVIANGNITTSANLSVTGLTTVTGNVDAGNLITAGLVSATGNVDAGNLITAGLITSTGNITGGNILTAGAISAAGNANVNVMYAASNIITAASLNANSGLVSSQTLKVTNNANIGTANITTVDSHLSPSGVTNWTLGAPGSPWRAVYAGANGVVISNVAITSDGSNIEIPNVEIDIARVNSFVATTSANLGPIGNFKVTGGSNGQILRTDGTGNLSFINPALIVLPVGTNTQVQFNDNDALGASSSLTFNKTTSTLFATQITGNGIGISNIAGANVSGAVLSAVVAQNVTACNQPNITSVGTLTSLSVSGNLSAGNANLGNLASANFVSGILTSTSQPNITLLGPLTGLTVSNITGQVNLAYTSDIQLGNIGNIHITGGANGQFLRTDGLGNLYWSVAQASRLDNGNSNISIDLNGNARFNIGGVANTIIIGRDNHYFTGTTFMPSLYVTNYANLGSVANVKITGGAGGQVLRTDGAGNLSWGQAPAAQSLLNGGTSVILNPSGNIGFTVGGVSNVITFTNTGMVGGRISGITGLSATGLIQLGALSNIKIAGGGVGQVIITDGTGNLSFTAAPAPISVINGSSNIVIDPSGSVITSIAGTPNVFVIANTGTTIAGKVEFSNVANVTIPGGNANQVLTTDGTGNLSWANPPAISFISNGTSNLAIDLNSTIRIGATGTPNVVVISNTEMTTSNLVVTIGANLGYVANLKLLGGSNGQILIANGNSGNVEWTTFPPANLLDQGTSNVQVNNSNIVISANGVANVVNITQTGMTVTGNVNASRINLANIANLKVSGGTSGQLITTDGAGNLSFSSLSNGAAIENGTSNVRFSGVNGTILLSVGGIGNVAIVTSSGINVAGVINATTVNATSIQTSAGVTAGGPIIAGGLTSTSGVSAADNINGNNVIATSNVNAAAMSVTGTATIGNLVAISNISADNLSATSNITSGNLTTGTVSATGIVATGTISSTGNINAANSLVTGTSSVTGNLIAGNISVIGTLSVPSFTVPDVNTSGNISAGGSVTAQNLFIAGTANINAGNLSVSGTIAQAATLSAGNLASPGTVSAAGSVTGGNILTTGIISSSANIRAPNAFISTNANVGNVFATGTISAAGNIVGQNIIGNFTGAIANGTSNIRAPIVNGPITVSVGGIANSLVVTNLGANVLGYANIGGLITGANLSITGNITGANLNGNVFGSRFTNGNSNVTINANSNVTVSVAGVANVLTVTNAGANIVGSANITGAAVVGTGLTLNASNAAQRFNINNAQTPATNPMSIYHDGSGLYVAGTGYTYFAEGLTYFQNPASFRGSIRNDSGTLTVNASSQLNVANTTASTTTTNGALVIAGGVGIAGNLNIGGVLFGNITGATVNGFSVGYRGWPTSNPTTPYTPVLTDAGRQLVYAGAATLNIPLNSSVAYPIGTEFKITNNSAGVITVTPILGVTLKLAGTSTVGTRSVGANGIATLTKAGTNTWFITGAGVT